MVEKKCDHIQASCDLSGDAFDGLELKNVSYKEVHDLVKCVTQVNFSYLFSSILLVLFQIVFQIISFININMLFEEKFSKNRNIQ